MPNKAKQATRPARITDRSKRPRVHRAKILDQKREFDRLIAFVKKGPAPLRDEVAVRLSFQAGLRAREIALLEWDRHLLTANGRLAPAITITEDIGKKCVARVIPIEDRQLRAALQKLHDAYPDAKFVFYPLGPNARGEHLEPNSVVQWFKRLYRETGMTGCSSHSGRRTFITRLSRRVNLDQCSLRDLQQVAGHADLNTTADYMEPSENTGRMVANVWA